MSDEVVYREFRLGVPIWDLSDSNEGDSPEIRALFALLAVTPPEVPLADLWPGDVLIFISEQDDQTFIAIDMLDDARDEMNTVGIEVCAREANADEVTVIMKSIRSSAEVASSLLYANFGLREFLTEGYFPRPVMNHQFKILQHAQFFRDGKLVRSTMRDAMECKQVAELARRQPPKRTLWRALWPF